jgi:hypothetical protein
MNYTDDPEYWTNWVPDTVHINSLAAPVRTYIRALEKKADVQNMGSLRFESLIQKVLNLELETAKYRSDLATTAASHQKTTGLKQILNVVRVQG